MKNILFTLLLCLSFISCGKEDIEGTTSMVTLSFNQQIVSGNSMTRATNEFLEVIGEQTPKSLNVALKNLDTDKYFYCKSDETITIPIGEYEISASKIDGAYIKTDNFSYYENPVLKVDTFNVTIDDETQGIKLKAYYNCYAVFSLVSECKSCSFNTKYGDYYVGYFRDNADITLTPYDDSEQFIETTFNFSTTYDSNKVFAEYGKYYVLHPNKSDKTTPSFDITLNGMEGGEI